MYKTWVKIHDLVYRHGEHYNSLYGHTLTLHVYTNIYCYDGRTTKRSSDVRCVTPNIIIGVHGLGLCTCFVTHILYIGSVYIPIS